MAFGEDAEPVSGQSVQATREVAHQTEQDAIAMELVWRTALSTALRGTGTSCSVGVVCGLCVAPQFPADDGARGTSQDLDHGANAVPLLDLAGQCLSDVTCFASNVHKVSAPRN
jgi:hypothetical protein